MGVKFVPTFRNLWHTDALLGGPIAARSLALRAREALFGPAES